MKHQARELSFNWGSDAFALTIQHTLDGERLQREREASEQHQKEQAQKQSALAIVTPMKHTENA